MQIRRGTTRVVFIAFGLVLKFPALKQRTIYGRKFHFMRGVIANASEFATYIMCDRASFLVPVFSLGIVSIQKFEGGTKPTFDEIEQVFQKLPVEAQNLLRRMDLHPFTPPNFRRSKTGLRMIDFGDDFSESFPPSYFLRRFRKEFEEALKDLQTATTE